MAIKQKFGKIDGMGRIVLAPSILKLATGGFIINPSDTTLRKEKYLLIEEVVPEHSEEDTVILDHYDVEEGKIVITYRVKEDSDSDGGATAEEVAAMEERIATLSSQNTVLASQNSELVSANEVLASDVETQRNAAGVYQQMYQAEQLKVDGLEASVDEWKGKYMTQEELQEQIEYFRSAAAKANYLAYIDRKKNSTSILKYGGEEDSSDSDTVYYKSAKIESNVEFVPLKVYKVSDGNANKFLVYTPYGGSVMIGGVPYPIVEAHGGDWVELQDTGYEMMDEESSDEDARPLADRVRVFIYQDSDGQFHCGTSVPEDAFWSTMVYNNNPTNSVEFHGQQSGSSTGKTYAVVVGMEHSLTNGDCIGCEQDANNMYTLLSGYSDGIVKLVSENATRSNVCSAIQHAVDKCGENDMFILYYSGHGGQDSFSDTGSEESDMKDEYMFLYDQTLRDNDLWNMIVNCKGRVFLMFDACHSQTMFRSPRIMPLGATHTESGAITMQCWSGCPDAAESFTDPEHGGSWFTNTLLKHFSDGLTYDELWSLVENDEQLKAKEQVQRTIMGADYSDRKAFR